MKLPREKGKFIRKSQGGDRRVRSLRATDLVWQKFGEESDRLCITRADLLELMILNDVSNGVLHDKNGVKNNRVLHEKLEEDARFETGASAPKPPSGTGAAPLPPSEVSAKHLLSEALSSNLSAVRDILTVLKQGITPKNQGGFYAGNNAKSLKEQVQIAIALLEQITE